MKTIVTHLQGKEKILLTFRAEPVAPCAPETVLITLHIAFLTEEVKHVPVLVMFK